MTREDIITTAFQVWGRQLYQSTSLTAIADALNVSKPALYRHFKNKNDLLDAMHRYFLDAYAAFLKPFYDTAVTKQKNEGVLMIIRTMTTFYARNEDFSIFFLIQIYGNSAMKTMGRQLQERGVDLARCYTNHWQTDRFVVATLTFILAYFHKHRPLAEGGKKPVADEDIEKLTDFTAEIVLYGLRFEKAKIEALDYEGIEKKAKSVPVADEKNHLLKAIGSAVAKSGPWRVSIKEIAQKSGLSKSSLYCHFENKRDMIIKFFVSEFERLIAFAEEGKRLSEKPEEQLYLIMNGIANYLLSAPDILTALDWLKTRRAISPAGKQNTGVGGGGGCAAHGADSSLLHFSVLFADVIPRNEYSALTYHLILFLIINTLMGRKEQMEVSSQDDSNLRSLYRFVTLGIDGSRAYAG
ncbi:MAG: TetR/AcrR family transcriptional regulator [Treponema sp.]|jgi:AcrR family transcriptional regulator|nr:TetR/AcrR family transcriptional regulator [Treponema sp.]